MPYLIGTPEGWFRINQRDLHLIRTTKEISSREEWLSTKEELHAWFADNLPSVTLGIVGPSEYSGWIEGGPAYITADFDSSSLAAFKAVWKDGSSWKIETWLFDDWRKYIEAANLLSSPVPETVKRVRWWDTPRGILMLNASSMGPFVDVEPSERCLRLEDGWWKIQKLFSEFSGVKADAYPCGHFWRLEGERGASLLAVRHTLPLWRDTWDSHQYVNDAGKMQELKNALGISDELPLEIYEDEYD